MNSHNKVFLLSALGLAFVILLVVALLQAPRADDYDPDGYGGVISSNPQAVYYDPDRDGYDDTTGQVIPDGSDIDTDGDGVADITDPLGIPTDPSDQSDANVPPATEVTSSPTSSPSVSPSPDCVPSVEYNCEPATGGDVDPPEPDCVPTVEFNCEPATGGDVDPPAEPDCGDAPTPPEYPTLLDLPPFPDISEANVPYPDGPFSASAWAQILANHYQAEQNVRDTNNSLLAQYDQAMDDYEEALAAWEACQNS